MSHRARHRCRGFARIVLMPLAAAAAAGVLTIALSAASEERQAPDAQKPAAAPAPSGQEMEQFLLNAKVVKTKSAKKGITGTTQATLSDGTLTHDASVQTIDEAKQKFEGAAGIEFNFKDSWMFNVAAYRLDRLIGLNMVPVSVPRQLGTKRASYTWWIDDVQMDEQDRLQRKIKSPDVEAWNEQMRMVRVFDQLLYNVDSNLTNLLITKEWRIWKIDHSRSFRQHHTLMIAANLTFCDRQMLERMKALDRPTLDKAMGDMLTPLRDRRPLGQARCHRQDLRVEGPVGAVRPASGREGSVASSGA